MQTVGFRAFTLGGPTRPDRKRGDRRSTERIPVTAIAVVALAGAGVRRVGENATPSHLDSLCSSGVAIG